MKNSILILICALSVLTNYAQTWQNVGNGLPNKVYDLIKFDNNLYAGGRIGVRYWDGSTWTSLPNPFGIAYPLTLAVYNDTLFVGGDFPWSGTISHVYKFDGDNWVSVGGSFDGTPSSTKKLLTYDGQLIASGHFSSINGDSINNIASWNGFTWNNLGNGLNGGVWYLAVHNEQLFASGAFTASGNDTTVHRFAKWDGLTWSPFDSAHRFNSTGPMTSFNGGLVIGNVWDTINGIQMKGIAKWTGSEFISMGNNLIKSVSNFWAFNNELYLSGRIHTFNPNTDYDVVLKWNGFFWQQVGQIFNEPVLTIEDFNDELFCGGFFTTCGSTSTPYIARTNITTGISEYNTQSSFTIFPNPTFDNIIFEAIDKGTLIIANQVGQILKSITITDPLTIIETTDLKAGVYILNFHTDNKITSSKLIKQ
jgi:hypothetical protein